MNVCTDSWAQGAAHGCVHVCQESKPCIGINMLAMSARDLTCRVYENSMPRPAVQDACRDAFVKGVEERCRALQQWAQERIDKMVSASGSVVPLPALA